MPAKLGEVTAVVLPKLGEAELAKAARLYLFDPVDGRRRTNPAAPASLPFRTSRRAYAFRDFVRSLESVTRRLPAFVCSEVVLENEYHIEFIWDSRNDARIREALTEARPYLWPATRRGYLFGPYLWQLTPAERQLTDDELRLVFLDAVDAHRRRFERLKARFDRLAGAPVIARREVIPEEVRMYVWRRDEGRCVRCGSNERLEYDHIIPVCKGGSNTERNIQLLCELCNRQKGDSI